MTGSENETEITLGVLSAIEDNSRITQRSVAEELGIALGLANSYLKKCIKKGLIKVIQAPANRYAYYLTPEGFSEKSRLTAEYLSISFNFFRRARAQYDNLFETCLAKDWNEIILVGCSELAEIAVLCSGNCSVNIVGILDEKTTFAQFNGIRVYRKLPDPESFDALVITDLQDGQKSFDALRNIVEPSRIISPEFLKISRNQPKLME